ncbi:MAG TPA: FIST N-terminal domain-containing protein [Acidimicrobiales bacterium]|nr:FIST N-terminal domain-containing protein [Acidimicrobiales bacterium]
MPFASALSLHPDPAEAAGEVVGRVLDRMAEPPDLVLLFCSPHHVDRVADIAGAVRSLLRPAVLVGTTAVAVVGGEHEVEDGPGVALWAARLAARPRPVRLTAASTPTGVALQGLSLSSLAAGEVLLLLADPFSLPVDAVVEALAGHDPPVPVVGGVASAARNPGGNRLVLDGEVASAGGVGVVLPAQVATTVIVSQGCRPVGDPMIVTRAEGNVVTELAGRPALDRLEQLVTAADPDERTRLAGGLHLGIAIDEHRVTFGQGDFLVRNLIGADRAARALAVDARLPVGTTVQFQVRDAEAADEDLRHLLAGAAGDGALLFTCNGRGERLFGVPHHDAGLVATAVPGDAVAGMFCAGEIGPVGGRSFLHGFTASVLVFHDRPPTRPEA